MFFAFRKIFFQCLPYRINHLHRRCKVHFSMFFRIRILHVQITVIRTSRILGRCFYHGFSSNNEGQSCHRHNTLLRGSHTEIQLIRFHVNGTHCVCRSGIHHKHTLITMYQSSNLPNWIKQSRPCLMVGCVDQRNIRVLLQCLLYDRQIRLSVQGHL